VNDQELTRLADMGTALRPDWRAGSLRVFLSRNLGTRAYADVAVALAVVATDERTKTPALLLEHGPWWSAVATARGQQTQTPGSGKEPACDRVGHEHELARNCRACRAEELAETEADRTPMAAAAAPEIVTEVAERHRRLATDRRPTARSFAQPEELRVPDNSLGSNCGRCNGWHIRDLPGATAHEAVFGHPPTQVISDVEEVTR
jgi:hypothetical protein